MTRARSVAFVAVVMAVVGLSAVFLTRNTRHEVRVDTAATPGFDGQDREVENSPFELAQPTTTAGPTTIPSAGSTSRRPSTTTTTTSTLPPRPLLPAASSIESVCGMVDSLQSLASVFSDSSLDAESAMTVALQNLDRYLTISPSEIRDDVVGIRASIAMLTDQMRGADWNTRDPAVQTAFVKIRDRKPPFQDMTIRAERVLSYESATCPG